MSTDRGDSIRARFVIMAVGILNLVKIPAIPGMETFEGPSFHTARWDYDVTGGSPTDWRHLDRLGERRVAVVGTGASAIQCVPPLAESSKQLYVFQRTPSAIGIRGNHPTDPEFAASLRPGWQAERMDNFAANMLDPTLDVDLVDDGWTHYYAKFIAPRVDQTLPPQEILEQVEAFDRHVMDTHRARVDEFVADPEKAAILKPYYRYMCKRPCFHDEYLPAIDRSNVTLVDCPAGVERVTPTGLTANGLDYDADLIVYATGFEAESTSLQVRAGHPIVGRDGLDLGTKWKDGVRSLHGLMSRGFPNFFSMPCPYQQSIVTVSFTHATMEGADHLARTIRGLIDRGVRAFDVSAQAESAWTEEIRATSVDQSAFTASCTPSRLNYEGDPSRANPANGQYGGGPGDLFAYRSLLEAWREKGDFEGLELEFDTT